MLVKLHSVRSRGRTSTARHAIAGGILATALSATLVSCAANPGPAPVEEDEPSANPAEVSTEKTSSTTVTPTTPPSRGDVVINVGISPLKGGLNPHLVADDSSFTQALASLVLPSTFRNGAMDTDVLTSAKLLEPAEAASSATPTSSTNPTGVAAPSDSAEEFAQTVRYVISPAAQWSDGTPITGTDFRYLWRAMTSTPGVVSPAGYFAIESIRTSSDGRTVDVDFGEPIDDWPNLFSNLLPSHVLQSDASDFAQALAVDIPTSAGRYMINSVDRARGIISINRNDRFWGAQPAETDQVTFQEIRTVTQGVEQLRSGQISFLDIIPSETSFDAYSLMEGTQVRGIDVARQLELTMSTSSSVLGEMAAREELHSLIDVPLAARLAAGRSADLNVAEHTPPRGPDAPPPMLLQQTTEQQPLAIGVDPGDDTATSAGRTLVDMLAGYGVNAEITTTDMDEITGSLLPSGEIDAIITWGRSDDAPSTIASDWLCTSQDEKPQAGNLSGYCTPETDELARQLLAGEVDALVAAEEFALVNEREHLVVPILGERRILVLGKGIVGPDPDLNNWTAGISTVPSWRKQ